VNRRTFLRLASTLSASSLARLDALADGGRAPAVMRRVLRDSEAPAMPSGVQSGDVTSTRAMIWSRTDRAARMFVEVSHRESMSSSRVIAGPAALEDSGFTARLDLGGLEPGEPVFYRVWFEDLARPGLKSAPTAGHLRTAPTEARALRICWSGDTVGQGWGINNAFGGLRLYETMARHTPDLFINSGDLIYADNPIVEAVPLDDGTIWRNVIAPAKRKVAETLDEFRGNYAYYLGDRHAQAFNAATPNIAQWDDHDVLNNWTPATNLDLNPAYSEKSIAHLAANARRALFEYLPIRPNIDDAERVYRAYSYGPLADIFVLDERSYRGANSTNRQDQISTGTAMVGAAQLEWLETQLAQSQATWKILASDQPIGLIIGDGERNGQPLYEAWANGDGPPRGRELELARLLSFIKQRRIENVVWITADVHYAAAHEFDPRRAVFSDFTPFWEFVAGPLHAGTFGPSAVDPTFGCKAVFNAIPPDLKPNRPPTEGYQFFGTLDIDPRTRRLTAALWNLAGRRLWGIDLDPL
jgi:alkaline phosphatase D